MLRHPIRLAPTLAAVVLLAGCGGDPKASAEAARKHFAGHQYLAAQGELAVALAAMPEDPALLELHARNALALGDGVAAGASLAKLPAVRRPPDFVLLVAEAALLRGQPRDALVALGADGTSAGLRLRALALLGTGDRAAADKAFRDGLAVAPRDARLLAAYARFTLMGGNARGARALVDRALAADGGALDAMLADAQVSTAEGDLARALGSYDKAARAYPGNLAAMTGKAGVLGDLGRIDEMEALLKSVPGDGGDGTVPYLKARAAAARGQWSKTREILQANEDKLADRDEASVLYSQALIALGQPEQARARLAPLLARHPENLLVRRELARAQMAGGDNAGAVATLRPLATSRTASADDLRLLAKAARAAGDPDLASFEARARYPSPRALVAALASADTAMKAGNWANAVQAYEQVMAVTDGRNPLVLNNLAIAHSRMGNRSKALGFAERAWKAAPGDPSVSDTYAWLLIETGGDRGQALRLLKEAATKAPGNATIRDHLANAAKG